MPVVLVGIRKKDFPKKQLSAVSPMIQQIIAEELSVTSKKLKPNEVNVLPITCLDTMTKNSVVMVIFAHNYQKRIIRHEAIRKKIWARVRELIPGKLGFDVSLILAPISWGEE